MPFDHFDWISGLYDRGAQFLLTDSLRGWLSLPADGLFLDVGGGTGRVAAALAGLTGARIVVDPSRGMLRYAHAKNLPVARAPAEWLPFPDESFARILMRDAFHHVRDHRRTALELQRILAPGGRIVIIEPDISILAVRWIAIFEKILLMRSHFFSGEELADFFREEKSKTEIFQDSPNVLIVVEKVK